MSFLPELVESGATARLAGADHIAVLHCVSAYPTPPEAQNLRAITTLADTLRIPVGLSDHGTGLNAAIAAVRTDDDQMFSYSDTLSFIF